MPNPIIGSTPSFAFICSMRGTGIGVPPVISIRSDVVSNSPAAKRGSWSIAMNIVGAPERIVARS